ncbi:MAG: hypothetical protein ACYC8T_34640, partial [Myxococcaceae bacterium]
MANDDIDRWEGALERWKQGRERSRRVRKAVLARVAALEGRLLEAVETAERKRQVGAIFQSYSLVFDEAAIAKERETDALWRELSVLEAGLERRNAWKHR